MGSFLRSVMGVYDDVYFGGQIRQMANGYGIDNFPNVKVSDDYSHPEEEQQPLTPRSKRAKSGIIEEVNAYKRSRFGVCDIVVVYNLAGEPKTITLDFYGSFFSSPQTKLAYSEAIGEIGDVCRMWFPDGKQHTLYTVMYIVEHILIHLLMVLWKYHEKGVIVPHVNTNYRSRWIYSTHGSLYRCLLDEYFGYRHPTSSLERMQVAFIRYYRLGKNNEDSESVTRLAKLGHPGISTFNPEKLGLLKWSNSSCFFDAIVLAILWGSSSHIRDTILKRAISSSDYYINDKFKNPFPGKRATSSSTSTAEFAMSFREHFKTTSDKLMDGNVFIACSIRSILGMVDTHINSGEQYEPYMVYGVLCNLFPFLKMRRVPNSRRRNKKTVTYDRLPEGEEVVAFPMDDFVTSSRDENATGVTYQFDFVAKEEHLAFFIQHPPWLKKWNDLEDEIYEGVTYSKKRKFDEYLNDSRYRLYAALIHTGPAPKTLRETSNGHYTLILRPFFDRDGWYYYDDMSPSFTKVSNGNVPVSVFHDSGKRRPHMLLYERIK